jgi:hypothetical protein
MPIMRRAARLVLVLALSLSIGLQWTLVQGVGWVRMVVSFSREMSVMKSVAVTLEGKRPCELCDAARNAENGPPASKTDGLKKQEPAVLGERVSIFVKVSRAEYPDFDEALTGEARLRPALPPPRVAA